MSLADEDNDSGGDDNNLDGDEGADGHTDDTVTEGQEDRESCEVRILVDRSSWGFKSIL